MKAKKQLIAKILKTSPKKVKISQDALEDVKKAITRSDMRGLLAVGKITKKPTSQQSRARARKIASQKAKGRRKGKGSRKGTSKAMITKKEQWMKKIRVQREFLKLLREKKLLSVGDYRKLYAKSKGGYFRNKRHIKLYLTEQGMISKENEQK